jgi:DNA-binding CsgD family transcriptional regulator
MKVASRTERRHLGTNGAGSRSMAPPSDSTPRVGIDHSTLYGGCVDSDAAGGGPGRLVAVVGDMRLLGESIALMLCAASIPAVAIELDALHPATAWPDAVVLVVRSDDDLADALERLDRSLPGVNTVLVASCLPRGKREAGPPVVGRLEIGASVDSLVNTVDRALRGKPLNGAASCGRSDYVGPKELEFLTPREREILGLLGTGNSAAQIAAQLEIAENTARTHIANIRSKLGVRTRLDAVRLVYGQSPPAVALWAR